MAMTIDECRTFLGTLADGKTDAQVETLRDELTVVANQMFDHLQSKVRGEQEMIAASEDDMKQAALDRIRWIAHAHENGPSPDDFTIERVDDKGAK
jgi:limonene-1,2-epoxide hydrolase